MTAIRPSGDDRKAAAGDAISKRKHGNGSRAKIASARWRALTLARSRWFILAAAALFSTGGAAIKGTALTAFQVAGFRSAVAALALALLLPAARRGFGWDLLPAAFAYAGTLVCFVLATKLTTSAAAIFLQSTAPIWILLLAPMLLKEKIRLADLPAVGLAAVGLGAGLSRLARPGGDGAATRSSATSSRWLRACSTPC